MMTAEQQTGTMLERLGALEAYLDEQGRLEAADFVEEVAKYVAALEAELADVKAVSGYQRSEGFDEGYRARAASAGEEGGEW